ncbi:NAD(P)H-dependent oxidoreductase [Nonomuraea thailandensis]
MLLHLDASARRASFSRKLSGVYADTWRAAHPQAGYVYRDLAARPVPHIGEAWTELCDHILEHEITDIARYREAARTPIGGRRGPSWSRCWTRWSRPR